MTLAQFLDIFKKKDQPGRDPNQILRDHAIMDYVFTSEYVNEMKKDYIMQILDDCPVTRDITLPQQFGYIHFSTRNLLYVLHLLKVRPPL